MRAKLLVRAVLSVLCLGVVAGEARAQPEAPSPSFVPAPGPPPWVRPRRLVGGFFGVSGGGAFVLGQQGGVEYLRQGGGLGAFGGVSVGRLWAFSLGYNASFHNPATVCGPGLFYAWCGESYLVLQTLSLDAQLRFPTGTRLVPYLQGGLSLGWIGRQGYLDDAMGGGFQAGGGVDLWLARGLTLGAQVLYRGLRLGDYAVYGDTGTYLSLLGANINLAVRF